jgi:hypothetical protein
MSVMACNEMPAMLTTDKTGVNNGRKKTKNMNQMIMIDYAQILKELD